MLWLVVIINVSMSYAQQRATSSVMSGFAQMAPDSAAVIRDGAKHEVPPQQLVPGDVVFLASGRNAPADVRIIFSNGLKCDFSSLTGENEAVRMLNEAANAAAEESRCVAFASSGLVEGEAYGVVVRTGDATMIGKIASLTAAGSGAGDISTLEADIHHFVKFIAILGVATAVVFFIIGIVVAATSTGLSANVVIQLFVNCFIVVVIANVPEGLPATVITCLTITARRMGARHVFIKKMSIIETLGCASVICSDKTGTITQNRMTVTTLFFNSTFSDAAVHGGRRQRRPALARPGRQPAERRGCHAREVRPAGCLGTPAESEGRVEGAHALIQIGF